MIPVLLPSDKYLTSNLKKKAQKNLNSPRFHSFLLNLRSIPLHEIHER